MRVEHLITSLSLWITTIWASAIDARQTTWVHPGIFVSKAQLAFTKAKVQSNTAPWITAYKAMDNVSWGKLTWTPTPFAMVQCEDGATSNPKPEQGCKEERNDALAAYSMALRWAYSGEQKYADKAIAIFDAWSNTIKGHVYSTSAPEQVGLQCGWVASSWTRAAEIIRYTGAGWNTSSISKFENMLKTVYLPEVRNGSAYEPNNIDSAMLEAAMGIAIFTENRTLYTSVVKRFKQHVPSYIYMTSDGANPIPPGWTKYYTTTANLEELWQYDKSYFQARAMETCRDLEHTSYGIASISHMLETVYIQGENLYSSDIATRLKATLEFHSQKPNGGSVASNICKGTLSSTFIPVAEPFYNGFVTRAGGSLPNTKTFIDSTRPAVPNYLFTAWETLTHALNPS